MSGDFILILTDENNPDGGLATIFTSVVPVVGQKLFHELRDPNEKTLRTVDGVVSGLTFEYLGKLNNHLKTMSSVRVWVSLSSCKVVDKQAAMSGAINDRSAGS